MKNNDSRNRRTLQDLAAQASSTQREGCAATNAGSKERRNGLLLAGASLMTCLGWLTYSQLLQPARESTSAATPAQAAHGSRTAPGEEPRRLHASTQDDSRDSGESSGSATPDRDPPKADPGTRDDELEERVTAVENFARRGSSEAVPAVMEALRDDDSRVRSRALDAAVNGYVAIPEAALIEHAQSDPSADVRFLALSGIAARLDPAVPQVPAIDRSTARALSRVALSDASEEVRWQAQQILDALDAQDSPADDPQSQAQAL